MKIGKRKYKKKHIISIFNYFTQIKKHKLALCIKIDKKTVIRSKFRKCQFNDNLVGICHFWKEVNPYLNF